MGPALLANATLTNHLRRSAVFVMTYYADLGSSNLRHLAKFQQGYYEKVLRRFYD